MTAKPGEQIITTHNYFTTDYKLIVEKLQAINPVNYANTRNFINGDITYLAPYISRGVISVKQVMDVILKKGYSFLEAEKLIQELAWREYYQRVWQEKKLTIWDDLKQTQSDVVHNKMLTALLNAQTNIEIIDQQIKNLYKIGYLHNHIRMYVAAIACNIGKAHWKTPSKWMYYHLFDGDIASNNCSWQWVAGAFSSKKYYCNQENINKYTYTNQVGTYLDNSYEAIVKMQVPDQLLGTTLLQLSTDLPITSLPIIDTSRPTLIYNSYNLDPTWRAKENVNRVLILEPSHFSAYPVSENVLNFILELSKNIPEIQIYSGEILAIKQLYNQSELLADDIIISKEHPAFEHYPGIKDPRDWMFPSVSGYYPSFFSFWKNCTGSTK
ncbi:MAG: deoxyribodipyrimidine photolyase [Bacteroidetes bacterium]|nr:deoxyribodipyrimidine photolyase [Bacteroidota bacterium]